MSQQKQFQKNTIPAHLNYQMCILSAIAILLVMIGHLNWGFSNYDFASPGTFYGWFPLYSFHLPLFLFITGYFFRDVEGKKLGWFVLKKAKNLLIPYYVINAIFLLIDSVIINWGFTFGRTFDFVEWLIFPWTRPYTITFSVPTWYLVALFISEIYFVLLRKVVSLFLKKDLAKEIVMLVLTLALGMLAVYFKNTAGATDAATVYLRSVVMLFFIQVGLVYRKYLEKLDQVPGWLYFLVIFAIQFIIIAFSGNRDLSPGLYALVNFDTVGYNYFLAGLTGVALWLRIAKYLAAIPKQSRFIIFVGQNTKYIMACHVFGYFLANGIFSLLLHGGIGEKMLQNYSEKNWHTYLYYICNSNERVTILYLVISLVFSLLVAKVVELVKRGVKSAM